MTEVSVVIRAKDEAADIGRVLELVEGQTLRPQIVVADRRVTRDVSSRKAVTVTQGEILER